jgi:hypothetical protein
VTIQISDTFIYGDTRYSLLDLSENRLASHVLQQYELSLCGGVTSCYRGCFGTYAIENQFLYLKSLNVFGLCTPYSRIDEIEPYKDRFWSEVRYEPLHEKLSVTGQLVIGAPFLDHNEFPTAWNFQELLWLEFVAGKIEGVIDLSSDAARIRGRLLEIKKEMHEHEFTASKRMKKAWRKEVKQLEQEASDFNS